MARRLVHLVVVVGVVALGLMAAAEPAAACSWTIERVGVSGPTEDPTVLVVQAGSLWGDAVETIELTEIDPDDIKGFAGGPTEGTVEPNPEALWRASSIETPAALRERVALGEAPDGFRNDVPLGTTLDPASFYEVRIANQYRSLAAAFSPGELADGAIRVEGSERFDGDEAAFRHVTQPDCSGGLLPLYVALGLGGFLLLAILGTRYRRRSPRPAVASGSDSQPQ